MPVTKGSYSFLKRDSFIDCFKIKEATATKLLEGKYEGKISSSDFSKIKELVELSPRHPYMYLKMLGIK